MKHTALKTTLFRTLSAIILLTIGTLATQAQYYMNIRKTDGSNVRYLVTDIDSVWFEVSQSPEISSYEYVDLGLSVKWATFNVGATKPEEYGDYYAWGETEPYYEVGYAQESPQAHWKDGYSAGYIWSNYKWCNGSSSTLTKYNTSTSYGTIDNKTVLDPEDDVAHVKWGGSWRMPTIEELSELHNSCTWTWYSSGNSEFNGVAGYKVTSNVDGYTDRFIFLPAAGCRLDTSLYSAGEGGYYWSSSLYADGPSLALYLHFDSGRHFSSNNSRNFGRSVRPVCPSEEWLNTVTITLNINLDLIVMGNTITLSATVKQGYEVIDSEVTWISDNPSIASVSETGVVTAVAVGSTTITAICMGKTATCTITVIEPQYENGYEYVDLGLSVKWATFNVGATKPEDYGDYYAWGETEPYYEVGYAQESPQAHWKDGYSAGYGWSNYKWYNGSYSTLTKYNTSTSYGTIDNKTVLDPEDDVAHVKWGGSWRMPTLGELRELRDSCTWTWYSSGNSEFNGVAGYKVTSNVSGYRGRSIFLPAAGYRYDTSLSRAGEYGRYWSSSLYTDYPYGARNLDFSSGNRNSYYNSRNNGQSVRPVCPSEERLNAVSITLNSNLDSIVMGNTITLSATVKHGDEIIDREVTWTSDNPSIASVSETGVVTAIAVGSTTITAICMGKTATCTITVIEPQNENGNGITSVSLEKTSLSLIIGVWDSLKAIALNGNEVVDTAAIIWQSNNEPVATVDSTGLVRAITVGTATIKATCGDKYATCIVTVLNHNDVTHEYVDLGLSVKWATCNVGAIRPEDHGGYYAWGETESKIEYKWENYKWCDGWWSKLTKYNSISVWGTVDNKKILDPEDDVVQANWGNNWRIPSPEELKELVDNCTWTWTTVDGIKGYSVTSNKTGYTDRSIFLPADGYFHYYDFVGFGQKGYYVSNTTGKSFNPGWPDCLVFDSEKKSVINSDIGRNFGFSIRPVCSK